jgi:hypothetical protein
MGSRARTLLAKWRDAVRDSDLSSTAKLVALALSTRMNRYGGAWPSKDTIAGDTSLGRRTVDAAIETLEREGYLSVSRSRGRSSNRYTATNPARDAGLTLQELPGSDWSTPQDVRPHPATAAPQPGNSLHPTPQELPGKASESIPPFPSAQDGEEGGSSNGEQPSPVDVAEMRRYTNGLVKSISEEAG